MSTESVFDTGYVSPNPKLLENETAQTAFLLVAEDSAQTLEQLGFSGPQASGIVENGYLNMFITSVSETHSDGFSLQNTISDTVYAFATGAHQVGISASGFLKKTPSTDDFVSFLKLYADKIRGRIVEKQAAVLYFGYKDTIMRAYILTVATSEAADMHGFIGFTFTAVASHYRNMTAVEFQGIASGEIMPDISTFLGGDSTTAIPGISEVGSPLAGLSSGGFAGPLGVDSLTGLADMTAQYSSIMPMDGGGFGVTDSLGLPTAADFSDVTQGIKDAVGGITSTVSGAVTFATEMATPIMDVASQVAGGVQDGMVTIAGVLPSDMGVPQVDLPDLGIPSINSVKWI